jgi:hypothetical protein
MDTKICNTCKIEKEINNFYFRKDWDKYINLCKVCDSNKRKEKYITNQEQKKEYSKNYYYNNKEKKIEYGKTYYLLNNDKKKEYDQKYYETYKIIRKKNNKKNRNIINKKDRDRYSNDYIYNITRRVRRRLHGFLKTQNITKKNTTFEIIGCTPEFLKEHLEQQFVDGMTWENRSEWHIDHIIPLSSANNEEEIYKLCHYTNLQPLWAEDNLKKGNKIVESNN